MYGILNRLAAASTAVGMLVVAILFALAAPAAAAAPGSWNGCEHWSGSPKVTSVDARSTGTTAYAYFSAPERDWAIDFAVTVSAYDSNGNYLWVVDRTTFTTKGGKSWTLDHAARPGWTLSFRVVGVRSLAPDYSCTAKNKV